MELEQQQQLIERARTDPEAFGEIFDAYYPKILGYAVRRTGDVAAAEDIVVEAFVKALRALPKYQWRGVSIEAWLYAITINEIRRYYRRGRGTLSLDELYEEIGFEPEDDYDLAGEAMAAQEALEHHAQFGQALRLLHTLPLKYQEVLTLRYAEHRKVADIATLLGKREGTIKSLLSRGLARLRAQMENIGPLQPNDVGRVVDSRGEELSKELAPRKALKPQERL